MFSKIYNLMLSWLESLGSNPGQENQRANECVWGSCHVTKDDFVWLGGCHVICDSTEWLEFSLSEAYLQTIIIFLHILPLEMKISRNLFNIWAKQKFVLKLPVLLYRTQHCLMYIYFEQLPGIYFDRSS